MADNDAPLRFYSNNHKQYGCYFPGTDHSAWERGSMGHGKPTNVVWLDGPESEAGMASTVEPPKVLYRVAFQSGPINESGEGRWYWGGHSVPRLGQFQVFESEDACRKWCDENLTFKNEARFISQSSDGKFYLPSDNPHAAPVAENARVKEWAERTLTKIRRGEIKPFRIEDADLPLISPASVSEPKEGE